MASETNNYFTSTIRRYGTDQFVVLLKPEQIQRSAKERIFREMVRGQIDYTEYGKYFLDSKFLENLIIAADNELSNNAVVSFALELCDSMYPGHIEVIHNRTKHNNLRIIYACILEKLNSVKMTGNVGYLTDIQFMLNSVKQYI